MAHRKALLDSLELYKAIWVSGRLPYRHFVLGEESETLERLKEFVLRRSDCLERSCLEGHITASALVCNQSRDRVLLTLHAKLGKWLQLGGHVDGDSEVARSARREAEEESGLQSLGWLNFPLPTMSGASQFPVPFDCDIHLIPARGAEPEHAHYDIRYLIVADEHEPLQITSESKALRWLSLTEARRLTQERSMLRQFDKLEAIDALLRQAPEQ